MYCSSYPKVLRVNYFSTFNKTLERFNEIWIIYIYITISWLFFERGEIKSLGSVGVVGTPQSIHKKGWKYKKIGGTTPPTLFYNLWQI